MTGPAPVTLATFLQRQADHCPVGDVVGKDREEFLTAIAEMSPPRKILYDRPTEENPRPCVLP